MITDTYEYGDPASKSVLIQPVDDHDLSYLESEISAIKELASDDFRLVGGISDRYI